jgi:hypothetical protein
MGIVGIIVISNDFVRFRSPPAPSLRLLDELLVVLFCPVEGRTALDVGVDLAVSTLVQNCLLRGFFLLCAVHEDTGSAELWV